MLEEAQAIRNLYPDGVSLRQASKELKRPTRWVHARLRLLDLPEEVQKWAAAGVISAVNIEAIHKLETVEEQLKAVSAIVKAKEGGKTKPLDIDERYKRSFRARKTKGQISEMVAHLYNVGCSGLATRVLAWVMGRVPDEEIEQDIQNAPTYQRPWGYHGPYSQRKRGRKQASD
jgi:hypothetical protein